MRPLPPELVDSLNPLRISDLNRTMEAARRASSLMGPGTVVGGGVGYTSVPEERFGVVLAIIKSRSASAPYEYEWAPATLDGNLETAETEGGGYGGFLTADGLYQTPAVNPLDPDGANPFEEDDKVYLQWDEVSRTWWIINPVESTSDRVILQIQAASAWYPGANYGLFPARIQTWVETSGALAGHWADASSTLVYVKCPNALTGGTFAPLEYVEAKFVEAYDGSLGGPIGDLYERTGLDGLHVGWGVGNTSFYPGTNLPGYPSTRAITFSGPFFHEDPSYVNVPGKTWVHIAPSTASNSGILMGHPFLGINQPGYNGSDPFRRNSVYQWARGGLTGFSQLMSNTLWLSNNTPPGSNGNGAVPADSEFNAWFGDSSVAISGGGGNFSVGITPTGLGFSIGSANGTLGTVNWGGSGVLTYNSYNIHTKNITIDWPGGITNALIDGWLSAGRTSGGGRLIVSPNTSLLTFNGGGFNSGGLEVMSDGWTKVFSGNKVTTGGITELGFSSGGSTYHVAQNYSRAQGSLICADLIGPNFPPSNRNGAVFVNGLYVGGLEWLLAGRIDPGVPPPSPGMPPPPIQFHVWASPSYPPPGPQEYWTSMSVGGH